MTIRRVKFLKIFFTTAATGLIIYSCSKNYLDKEALGLLDENVLANSKGVETLLIGAYSMLDGISFVEGSRYNNEHWGSACSNWIYGSICGTEAYKGGNDQNDQHEVLSLETFNPLPGNLFLGAKWRAVYDGIQRSNDVLRTMRKAKDITPENEKRIAAEARFLRAHYHFEAKKIWNNIPYVAETISYENNNYHASNQEDTWPFIEKDLVFASENLKDAPHGGSVGRANRYMAMALLAKAYLFQKKFAEAKPLLEKIISSGKYELTKNYGDNFNPAFKNNSESIFSVQMSVNDGSKGYNGNFGDVLNFPGNALIGSQPGWCCSFFQPSQYLVNHFKTDPNSGLPEFATFNNVDVKNDEDSASTDSFIPDDRPLDSRLDWTVGRRGIPYLDWGDHPGRDWIVNQREFGPYSPKKNVYYKSQERTLTDNAFWTPGATANNVNLIRYADVLLWAAESEIEIGSPEIARAYINKIRERAADPAGWVKRPDGTPAATYKVGLYVDSWTDKNFARTALRFERMLELGMEGHRFFDLVRWGIADIEIKAYWAKEKQKRKYLTDGDFKKNCNEYFPIPQTQIDLSAGADGVRKMKQHPCY